MIDKWTGSIEVGVTVLQPDKMEIPATITSIQSNTWVMSGCNIASGGKTLKDNYGISLDTLKVCVMSVCVCACACVCVCMRACVCLCVCVCVGVGACVIMSVSICMCLRVFIGLHTDNLLNYFRWVTELV